MSTQQYPFLPQMLSPTSYAMGRPLTTTHKIGNGVQRTISSKSYDELGRLSADNRNGLASLKETRSYNLRSWLTNIEGQMFTEALKYEDSAVPQWGGNISVMQWGESAVQNAYSFIYDTHSRLQTANYSNSSSAGLYSEIYNYDLNGNMLRHVRGSQPLVMNYSGNRLTSAGNAAFEYDAKGRQVMSAYGSGLSTLYNILDLPQRQTTGEGTVVNYKYAFDGRKLQEKVTAGTSVTQRDYSGEFLYEGGVLKKILFNGGYVMNGESGPVYMFFLRDHLGSVRAVVSETGAVQQRNNYFPYGDLFPSASNDSSGNRYRYTGKESGDEIGLYDFSARFLHTRFGRFTTIDPLAEKYPDISPYVYCNCNPVNFVDPDGKKLRVPKEYQQPFLMDMKLAFGNKVELFSFDDAGILSIEARNQKFTSGLTSEQKKLFKGLTKVVRSKNITSVVYADEYELTIDNDKATHNILIEFGGGVYSKSDDVIVISPNVGAVEVTKDQFPFKSEIVEQNTTSTLFHEIGERNTHNVHYRGNVIDYENLVRRILKLPQRPYDLNHTNDIETKYQ